MSIDIDIDVDEIKKIYEEMTPLIRRDLKEEFDECRITGPEFSAAYITLTQAILNGAMQAVVSIATKETDADRCLKNEQCASSQATTARNDLMAAKDVSVKDQDIATKKAQEAVLVRQESGFDDNLRQKLFESQMNAWALMFSSGLLEDKPCFIASDEASKLYKGILDRSMPAIPPKTPAECCVAAGGVWNASTSICDLEAGCIANGGAWDKNTSSCTYP